MKKKNLLFGIIFILIIGFFFVNCGSQEGENTTTDEKDIKSFYTTTMADMKNIGTAIESYMVDNSEAPQVETFSALPGKLQPDHIVTLPLKDSWGNDYLYQFDPNNKEIYWIASAGSDGKFDGFDQTGTYPSDRLTGQDIIYSNGTFQYFPK